MASTATIQIFGSLEAAYAHFNHSLFDGQLPEVVFALSNKGRSVEGYFLPNKFSGRSEKAVRDEIALNPLLSADPYDTFRFCAGRFARTTFCNRRLSRGD